MRAKLFHYKYTEAADFPDLWFDSFDSGLSVDECKIKVVITHPPSSAGKEVFITLNDKEMQTLMKELKRKLISIRSKSMSDD